MRALVRGRIRLPLGPAPGDANLIVAEAGVAELIDGHVGVALILEDTDDRGPLLKAHGHLPGVR